MTGTTKPGPNASLRAALAYVARHPRLYPAVAALTVRHGAAKARFYVMCWRSGYRVRTVRRVGREAELPS